MQTKLTLRMANTLVRKAKRHSRQTRKSVSQMVADYFALMDSGKKGQGEEPSPRVRSLMGAFAGSNLSEKTYRDHLEEKYR